MGACCCNCNTENRHISTYMSKEKDVDGNTMKMLLLGPGSTGKTTLFKSLQMYHNGGQVSDEVRRDHIDLIRYNVLDGIATLIRESDTLYKQDNLVYGDCRLLKTKEIEPQINVINRRTNPDIFDSGEFSDSELNELCECIACIWKLPCIQATYKHRFNNFAISDNLEHFFNKLSTIFGPHFVPNEKDCLLNRIRTTGMIEYEYRLDRSPQNSFKILDVGGQRTERRKWLHYFDKFCKITLYF